MEGVRVYAPDPELIWLPSIVSSASKDGKLLKVRIQNVIGPSDENVLAAFESEAKLRDIIGTVREIDLTDPAIVKVLESKHTSISSSINEETTGNTSSILSLPLQNAKDHNAIGYEDMIRIDHLHEASILYNLRKRFFHKLPYTYTGKICIAVNPYEWLGDLYSKETMEMFCDGQRENKPPHVYAVSMEAFLNLRHKKENQSILVSGESGAGKTETTKIVMSHFASLASNSNSKVIQQIMQVNPLLESFGNAKTVKNDNSSRFGKFTELQFNSRGELVGAQSRTYLLEKSRVTKQSEGEQNFHIFYQLLAKRKQFPAFQLDNTTYDAFKFVRESDILLKNKEKKKKLKCTLDKTCQVLELIGIQKEIQKEMFAILAAILHLGQVTFCMGGQNDDDVDTSSIVNVKPFEIASELLQVNVKNLQKAICFRSVVVGKENISKPNTKDQAQDCRDALAKSLYANLFSWLVLQINQQLGDMSTCIQNTNKIQKNTIGILDIFGFEVFEQNSFEQFCINYANEKIQQKFVQDILKIVQFEYEEEKIIWNHIDFQDNQQVLTLIEGRMGLLSFLNEESLLTTGSDLAFMNKIGTVLQNDPLFEIPLLSQRNAFIIHHYAGKVKYEIDGFIEKHRDALLPDIKQAIQKSTLNLLQQMFTTNDCSNSSKFSNNSHNSHNSNNSRNSSNSRSSMTFDSTFLHPHRHGSNRRHSRRSTIHIASTSSGTTTMTTITTGQQTFSSKQTTVGAQFKESLSQLMEKISQTNVHYVRCLKPNGFKTSQVFHHGEIINQLRCAGVIEAIRISRSAYPSRLLHEEFIDKFSILTTPQLEEKEKKDLDDAAKDKDNADNADDDDNDDDDDDDNNDDVAYWRQKCLELIQSLLPKSQQIDDYQIGATRIYFRHGLLETLETKRSLFLQKQICLIQRFLRGWVQRQKYRRFVGCSIKIQTKWRQYCQKKNFQKIYHLILLIQAWYRGQKIRQEIQKIRQIKKIIFLQAWVRGFLLQRCIFLKKKKAACQIQFFWRSILIRLEFLKKLEKQKKYKALGSKVAILQKKLEHQHVYQQISIGETKTMNTSTTTRSSTIMATNTPTLNLAEATSSKSTSAAMGKANALLFYHRRLSGSSNSTSTTMNSSSSSSSSSSSNSSSNNSSLTTIAGGILDESQELITFLHEENERLRLEMEKQCEEMNNIKNANRQYREWQKSKEVDEKVQKIAYRDQENKDLNYLFALEKEYEKLRIFICETFQLDVNTGTISTPATSSSSSSSTTSTAPSTHPPPLGPTTPTPTPTTPTTPITPITPITPSTPPTTAAEVHGLLLKSAQRLSFAKTKSTTGKGGSTRRVRDHWEEIKNFPPPMHYSLGSIPWKRLLTDWAQGNPKKLDYMTRWLKNVLDGGSIVSETFPMGVELKSVTPMMLDGFMQLVIPKLAERKDINVHVHTKEFIGTSMRITLSMKDGTKFPNKTTKRLMMNSSQSMASSNASKTATTTMMTTSSTGISDENLFDDHTTDSSSNTSRSRSSSRRLSRPSRPPPPPSPSMNDQILPTSRISVLINNENVHTQQQASSPAPQTIAAAIDGGSPGSLTTRMSAHANPETPALAPASPPPPPPSPPQPQQTTSTDINKIFFWKRK